MELALASWNRGGADTMWRFSGACVCMCGGSVCVLCALYVRAVAGGHDCKPTDDQVVITEQKGRKGSGFALTIKW